MKKKDIKHFEVIAANSPPSVLTSITNVPGQKEELLKRIREIAINIYQHKHIIDSAKEIQEQRISNMQNPDSVLDLGYDPRKQVRRLIEYC